MYVFFVCLRECESVREQDERLEGYLSSFCAHEDNLNTVTRMQGSGKIRKARHLTEGHSLKVHNENAQKLTLFIVHQYGVHDDPSISLLSDICILRCLQSL